MEGRNQKIAMQLQSVSNAFLTMDDDELMSVLLDTCSALLNEVEKQRPSAANMSPMEQAEYTVGYTQISTLVGHYAQELQEAEPDEVPAGHPVDFMAQLEQARQDIQAQRIKNQTLQKEVQKHTEELNSLRDFYNSMLEISQTCTPEIIDAQKKDNQELLKQVSTQQQLLDQVNAQKQQHDATLLQTQEQIRQVEEAICQIPETHKKLLADYESKCEHLRRLQNAQELCSEEKQADLEQQILTLKPTVEKLEQQMETLNSHLQNLMNSQTELDRENQILSTNLLDCISKAMGDLNLILSEHQQSLEEIRQQANTFRSSLAECERIRNGLEQWLGSNRRQFEAALVAIEQQEYITLKQTLDLTNVDRVEQGFSQARAALDDVDRILKPCAKAAQKDRNNIKGRAVE